MGGGEMLGVGGSDPLSTGMRELLLLLPEDTLKTFLSTVTGYLVKYGSVPKNENGEAVMDARTHAIHTIMMYSDPRDLLGRQKMTRAILSEYLNQKQVKMTLPATKRSLCEDVLRHWGVIENGKAVNFLQSPKMENKPKIDPEESKSWRSTSTSPSLTHQVTYNSSSNGDASQNQQDRSFSSQSTSPSTNNVMSLVSASPQEVETMECENENAISMRNNQEIQLGFELAQQFSKWYYERLNSLSDFSASHFWPESNLRIEMILAAYAENTIIDEILGNGEVCCAKLKDLVVVKQLHFNPNTVGSGIKGYLSPHGLGQVFVCGTLHEKNSGVPVGVFEQMFGLMRDPRFGNNYKIKFTVLRLREGSHLAIQESSPELCDTSLVGIIEEVD